MVKLLRPIKLKKPVRSYTGVRWRTNKTIKKYLAKDFDRRCAYCDDLDIYSGGRDAYHVEHFAPKEKFSELKFTYENLLYSCPYCNISKSNKWVGRTPYENVVGDKGFVDPCSDDYYKHLARDDAGNIIYLTPLGKYMYYELKLYLKRHSILYNVDQIRMRWKRLRAFIMEKSRNGDDVEKLMDIFAVLSIYLCNYYDFYFEDLDENDELDVHQDVI